MNVFPLIAFNATQPADYLAALGLTRACPNSPRLSFTDATPHLHTEDDPEHVAAGITAALVQATTPEAYPISDHIQTTVPTWSTIEDLSYRSWDEPAVDQAMRAFDFGVINGGKPGPDPQVSPGSLILISGRSYVRKILEDLWPTPESAHAPQIEQLTNDIRALLNGNSPHPVMAPTALRYSTVESSPRLRTGTETAVITPAVELLAFYGAMSLLASQVATASGRRQRPGMTWALNPVPLTMTALVAIHEQRTAPASWPRYTTAKIRVGGGAKTSYFADTHPLERA